MTRIYIQEERPQESSTDPNDIILKIHKRVNDRKELVHYYVRILHNDKPARDFTFEYIDGNLGITRGTVSQHEFDLLIRSIQILELSDPFPGK